MNRDEILESNKKLLVRDEGTEFIENRARLKGEACLVTFMLLLMVYNFFKGIPSYDLMTVFWAYMSVTNFYKYRVNRQRLELVTSVAALIAALGFLVSYILQTW